LRIAGSALPSSRRTSETIAPTLARVSSAARARRPAPHLSRAQ
jgi:hypothetical protein